LKKEVLLQSLKKGNNKGSKKTLEIRRPKNQPGIASKQYRGTGGVLLGEAEKKPMKSTTRQRTIPVPRMLQGGTYRTGDNQNRSLNKGRQAPNCPTKKGFGKKKNSIDQDKFS